MSTLNERIERLKDGHNDGERPIAAAALDLLTECQAEIARLESENKALRDYIGDVHGPH